MEGKLTETEERIIPFGSLKSDVEREFHKAMFKSLQSINGYFDSPHAAKVNLLNDVKLAASTVNSFAKIRQAESGMAMAILQLAKAGKSDESMKGFLSSNLPHIKF